MLTLHLGQCEQVLMLHNLFSMRGQETEKLYIVRSNLHEGWHNTSVCRCVQNVAMLASLCQLRCMG